MPDLSAIQSFLETIDADFVVPISSSVSLPELAIKFYTYATLCYKESDGRISALVAGYTKNAPDNIGYISLVAAEKEQRNKGICTKLVSEFLEIARSQGLSAVHVYTHISNTAAVAMYRKNGFQVIDEDETKDLVHLLCVFSDSYSPEE